MGSKSRREAANRRNSQGNDDNNRSSESMEPTADDDEGEPITNLSNTNLRNNDHNNDSNNNVNNQSSSDRNQQQSSNSQHSSALESVLIYDQNRNSINIGLDQQKESTQPITQATNEQLARGRSNESPVLSLTGSDETSTRDEDDFSANCSANSSSTSNPTTCSTQRLSSQASLTTTINPINSSATITNTTTTTNATINSPAGSGKLRKKLRCSSEHPDAYSTTTDDDEDDELKSVDNRVTEESIMIRMLGDNGNNDDDLCNNTECDRCTKNPVKRLTLIEKPEEILISCEKEDSLVRQFGRRVSVIPQLLFARRTCRVMDEKGLRRFSMQDSRQSSHELSTELSDSNGTGNGSNLPDQAPTTVAGVGGTITTVTRGTRKTAPLPRLVAKNGTVNLFIDNIDRRQYVRDLFTTMIDIKWRYNLMAAAFGFVFSWIFFACIWYIVLYVHDDLVHENDPTWSPCIVNVNSFSAALLFSIETQSTLGFGSRIISVECPGAIVIFCIQLIFGVVVECLIVGMVFAKLSRPAKRSQTIMFSKYATVCLREGQMCLMFRVGDVRSKSHIIGATIRASLVSQKITQEGETIPFYHHQLEVKIDDAKNQLLLIWPVTIVHLIDESSPFYGLNCEELANFKFEIITVLEGTVESTGQSIQVRSSYLPSEVKWGYRFEPIVSTHGFGRYAQTIIDYNKFNRVIQVDTPTCSPMEYYATDRKQYQAGN